jgi:hypothetical protein
VSLKPIKIGEYPIKGRAADVLKEAIREANGVLAGGGLYPETLTVLSRAVIAMAPVVEAAIQYSAGNVPLLELDDAVLKFGESA